VGATGGEIYRGAGEAVRQPLHDLNMMQDPIPPVLLRAELRPYDQTGIDSCNDVLDRVAELDLALGPDVDTPKEQRRSRVNSGAHFTAATALDAAGSAVEHFIPLDGELKQITGAKRYEKHVQHATLAGADRRSFLKAMGMQHNCTWPAAPLAFTPAQPADPAAAWTPAQASNIPALNAPALNAPALNTPALNTPALTAKPPQPPPTPVAARR
ncbi:MAG: hypothetical protein WA840_24045, partial [Caulobacteraceae bacterium]